MINQKEIIEVHNIRDEIELDQLSKEASQAMETMRNEANLKVKFFDEANQKAFE